MNLKNISDCDNQETIAKLLWDIRMTRIKLGGVLIWFYLVLFVARFCI